MGKYGFTGETKEIACDGRTVTLHRIRALAGFGDVKAGDTGGWVESEGNLSQDSSAWVDKNARVYGGARVYGNARVRGSARVYGGARVHGKALVCGNAVVNGDARVHGKALVCGNAVVYEDAVVNGDTVVNGEATLGRRARVSGTSQLLSVGPIGSRDCFTTFYRDADSRIRVQCGCFNGTLEEFIAAVGNTHGSNRHAQAYRMAAGLARLQIGLP